MQFQELRIGQTFDFVNPTRVGFNPFFHRCIKTSTRTFSPLSGVFEGRRFVAASRTAHVYHVSGWPQIGPIAEVVMKSIAIAADDDSLLKAEWNYPETIAAKIGTNPAFAVAAAILDRCKTASAAP